MSELERLRADLEVLERYFCDGCAKVVRDKIAALEAAADPWREAKQVQAWLRDAINRQVVFAGATQISEYLDHLTDENARLEKRVAELEAALKRIATVPDCGCVPCRGQCDSAENLRVNAEEIREIARISLEGVKTVADMQPPFEGPIVGIEPVLDPARVLATAAEIFDQKGQFSMRMAITFYCQGATPYRLKGAGDES